MKKQYKSFKVMHTGCWLFFLIENIKEEILMMGKREMYMLSYRLYYVILI